MEGAGASLSNWSFREVLQAGVVCVRRSSDRKVVRLVGPHAGPQNVAQTLLFAASRLFSTLFGPPEEFATNACSRCFLTADRCRRDMVSTLQTGVVLGCFAAMDSDESGAFAGQIGSAMVTRREPLTPNPCFQGCLRHLGSLSESREFLPLQPPQAALMLLVQRAEARPVVAAHEQQQEWNREEVVRLDGESDHRREVGAHQNLYVRQPAAAATVLLHFQIHRPVADRVFRSSRERRLYAEQRLQHRTR